MTATPQTLILPQTPPISPIRTATTTHSQIPPLVVTTPPASPAAPKDTYPDVPLSKLREHIQKNMQLVDQDQNQFLIEFKALTEMCQKLEQTPNYVYKPINGTMRNKNRYQNILTTASTRVKLTILPHDSASHYINASYIAPPLPGCKHRYIAASAPVPATFDDWWRMVWEQNVGLIVMVTKEVQISPVDQKTELKAHRYWPTSKGGDQYDSIHVALDSKLEQDDTITRSFTLTRTLRRAKSSDAPEDKEKETKTETETRTCTLIQYTGWPDLGVPEHYESFAKFLQKYREHRTTISTTTPILIHCSAGIGRTGAFIAVDALLDHINLERIMSQDSLLVSEPTINMFALVKSLRDQRLWMVQSPDQYLFCHAFVDYCVEKRLFGVGLLESDKENAKMEG